jgi:hypothetical protein
MFRFVQDKSKIPNFEWEKTKIFTADIPYVFRGWKSEFDPREIGSAFHGAGAEIGQK